MAIEASLKSVEGGQLIGKLASAFGIDDQNAGKAVEALMGALGARVERNMLSRGGVADVLSLVTSPPASAARTPHDLASQRLADAGNHALDVLIGSKHISRGIAARAASQANIDAGTAEKMLPVAAALLIDHLRQQSRPALEKLMRNVPDLAGAGGSPLPMPGDHLPTDEAPAAYVPASGSTQTAPLGPIDAGPPLPVPGDDIPGLGRQAQQDEAPRNPYDRLPDIVRRGGGPNVPGEGSLSDIIRSIFGNVLGNNRGVIGTMIQLFLIRWIASIAQRILARVLRPR